MFLRTKFYENNFTWNNVQYFYLFFYLPFFIYLKMTLKNGWYIRDEATILRVLPRSER